MSDIEAVKSRLDIVEVIGSYIPIKRAGQSYKANCPFHKEKTPSFVITPSLQIYKCFGCGEGGDVLSFIQKIERVEFPEGLKIAAEKAGYELKGSFTKNPELEKTKQRIISANELATKYWNYILKTHPQGKPGRNYMQKRGISPKVMELFKLGYAPKGTNLIPFMLKKGYSEKELISLGMAVNRSGKIIDKFRDRFILPVYDKSGDIVAFSGRIVGKNDYAPKYLNSPETLVYKKGETLMGLYQAKEAARKEKFLILQEGNIDLLSSHRVGVENIVASGGTALTEQQIKLIKRHVDTVYFAFDNDSAGIKALIKGVELCEQQGLAHKALDMGAYKDPDELITANPDLWRQVIEEPRNSIDYLFSVLAEDLDLGSPDGKTEYAARVVPILKSLQDKIQQNYFTEQLALAVGLTTDNLKQIISSDKKVKVTLKSEKMAEELDSNYKFNPNKRELYLLALILQLEGLENVEINGEIFTDVNAKELFVMISTHGSDSDNFSTLVDELSDGAAETLQIVLSTSLDHVESITKEFNRTYKAIYTNYLRRQILDLRRTLQFSSNSSEDIAKLQFYTNELHELTRN